MSHLVGRHRACVRACARVRVRVCTFFLTQEFSVLDQPSQGALVDYLVINAFSCYLVLVICGFLATCNVLSVIVFLEYHISFTFTIST